MRALCLLVVAVASALIPQVAAAQSSWDVTIVSATGAMQMIQGRTYRAKEARSPFSDKLRLGSELESIGTFRIHARVCYSTVNQDSAAVIVVERDHAARQRFEPISSAVLRTPGPGQSFSGTVQTSDGGSVTISVVANP